MGFYNDRVLPRLIDIQCGSKSMRDIRGRVCAGLSGEVIEIGFGSGHNVPFYPAGVTRVSAIEPAERAWRLAADRVAESPIEIERAGLDGALLPFPDATFDAALSTWTRCTIPDPRAALREVRRVLRPGGAFGFVEHGLAPDERVRVWQRRLEPIQKRVAGGCHLTRPIADLIVAAGFTITDLDTFYPPGTPKFTAAFSLGTARA